MNCRHTYNHKFCHDQNTASSKLDLSGQRSGSTGRVKSLAGHIESWNDHNLSTDLLSLIE